MSEERDPYLQSLFAEQDELDHADFLSDFQQEIQRLERLRWLSAALLGAVLILILWLMSEPLYVLGVSLTLSLTAPIIEMGDGLISLMLSPVNNVASILILTAKLGWSLWKRVRTESYA